MILRADDLSLDTWITEGLKQLQAFLDKHQAFITQYGL
jgi:hypothetical protein